MADTSAFAVQGIIVDGFSAIRDDGAKLDQEMRERCFICGMSASMLKSESDGFEAHIRRDHSAFKYVFYIDYILCKPVTERTGLESFVIERYSSGNFSFLPDGDCLRLRDRRRHTYKQRDAQRKRQDRQGGLNSSVDAEAESEGAGDALDSVDVGRAGVGAGRGRGAGVDIKSRLDRLEDALGEMRRLLRDAN